jgi:hypothetical protein
MRLKTKLYTFGVTAVVAAGLIVSSSLHAGATETPAPVVAQESVETLAGPGDGGEGRALPPSSGSWQQTAHDACRRWTAEAWKVKDQGRGYAFFTGIAVGAGGLWIVSHLFGNKIRFSAQNGGGQHSASNAQGVLNNGLTIVVNANVYQNFVNSVNSGNTANSHNINLEVNNGNVRVGNIRGDCSRA